MKNLLIASFSLIGILGFAGIAFALPYYSQTQSMVPGVNDKYNIGTTTPSLLEYNNIYAKNLTLSGICTGCSGTIPLAKGNFLVGDDSGTAQATSTIFITSLGQVGIGTLTPTAVNANSRLTVAGIGAVDLVASTTDNTTLSTAILEAYAPGARVFIGAHGTNQITTQYGITVGGWGELGSINSSFGTSNGLLIGTRTTNTPIVFGTNSLERMRITGSGAVGIGLTNPGAKLEVQGTTSDATAQAFIAWNSSATNLFNIQNSGNVGIGTSSPTQGILEVNGTTTISNISNGVLTVGANGLANPAFQVSASTSAAVAGIQVQGGLSGDAVKILTTDSGANAGLNISSKGTGALMLNGGLGGVGTVGIQINGANRLLISNSAAQFTETASNTAGTPRFQVTNGADVALTAATEAPWAYFNGGLVVRTHATGAIPIQRDFRITGNTHNFAAGTNAANTIASSTAFEVDGTPSQGAFANFTNAYGVFINNLGTLTSASTTNAYGLGVMAPMGAANNYAAEFLNGNVGIGTTSPWRTLGVTGTVAFPNLTTSAGFQTGVVCVSATGELINDSVACLASARRFKENIAPLSAGLDEVLKLQPVEFTWKKDYNGSLQSDPNKNGVQYSLIADDVQKVDSRLVSVTVATSSFEGKTYAPGTVEGLADTNHWVALFVKSFQDVVARISGLEERLDSQQKEIDNLQTQINQLKRK